MGHGPVPLHVMFVLKLMQLCGSFIVPDRELLEIVSASKAIIFTLGIQANTVLQYKYYLVIQECSIELELVAGLQGPL